MRLLYAALAAICLAGAAQAADPIIIHGSTTVAGTVMMPHKADIEKAAGVTLDIVAYGSGNGLLDLAAGKAQIAMISAPFAKVAASLADKGAAIKESDYVVTQIGQTKVAFITHSSNTVTSLTFTQLGDILTGKIKNWKEIGGGDAPILVIVEPKGGGLRSMVEKDMLGGTAEITAEKREVPGAPLIPKIVAQVPNALGLAIAATVGPEVHELATDKKLEQPLFLVTKGAPDSVLGNVIAATKSAAGQ
jgi:phosphate transport system substrate-binding protein